MKRIQIATAILILTSCASKSDLDSALTDNVDLKEQIASQSEIIDDLEEDGSNLEASLSNLQIEYDHLSGDNSDLNDELSSNKSELIIAKRDLARHICSEQITDMKYENIYDVSTILAGWWAKQDSVQSVQGTYRDAIWNNTDTKIHSVNFTSASDQKQYVEHFLVFFDEFGWRHGIYWLSGQCWLDSPFD